jgi:HSP20 family protein
LIDFDDVEEMFMEDIVKRLHSIFDVPPDRYRGPCWRPAADIYRTQTGWLVKYDLAGVTSNDIEITISGSTVTLHGCRRDWRLEDGCRHYSMEIPYSAFERSIDLACELERARLKIQWRDGILLLRLLCEGGPK